MTKAGVTQKVDAVVMGAGVAGLYQLYQLRKQGLKVVGLEAGSDVGGTWYWNRYPGARFDSEGLIYQYIFDEDLYKSWSWSERFPGQPEIERWLHWIADRLDLRKDFVFNSRVTKAQYDEQRGRWIIETDNDQIIDTQFFVSCGGMLSAPVTNQFEGQDTFKGEFVYTSLYPRDGVDVKGKRVGVVGIGATGIQVIQSIAADCGKLTVFARTPQYTLPMKNPALGPKEVDDYKSKFEETKNLIPNTFSGFQFDFEHSWDKCTPEERLKVMEDVYADGSLKMWLSSFPEIFSVEEASHAVSDFVRNKMIARLQNDPHLVETLVPKVSDYGFGTHRVPLERNYLEVYLRDNVEVVSVRKNPIRRIVPEGIELTDGTVYPLDTIILATGFDAGTGALSRIDVRGRGGVKLADEWGKEIRTTFGFAKHGFPNLLMTATPLAPSAALCNMTTCLQQQTEWIADVIQKMRADGKTTIEATEQGEDNWVQHHDKLANATLVPKTDSWYMGSNIPGKPRRLLSYIGGVGTYRKKCQEEAEAGYPSFVCA